MHVDLRCHLTIQHREDMLKRDTIRHRISHILPDSKWIKTDTKQTKQENKTEKTIKKTHKTQVRYTEQHWNGSH